MLYVTSNRNRFCMNCPYAKFIVDRFYCPFIEGSCIKIPRTIEHPDPESVEMLMVKSGYLKIDEKERRKWK